MAFDSREHLMSIPMKDIPDSTLQAGHYYGQIMRCEHGVTPWNSESESFFFHVQLVEPGPDIDKERIKNINLREVDIRAIAYEFVPSQTRKLTRMLKSLGLDDNRSLDFNLSEVIGKRVLCTVNAKPSGREGDDTLYNNIVFMVGVPD